MCGDDESSPKQKKTNRRLNIFRQSGNLVLNFHIIYCKLNSIKLNSFTLLERLINFYISLLQSPCIVPPQYQLSNTFHPMYFEELASVSRGQQSCLRLSGVLSSPKILAIREEIIMAPIAVAYSIKSLFQYHPLYELCSSISNKNEPTQLHSSGSYGIL